MDSDNSIVISAVLVEKKELCYTPAGIAVFEAKCHYAGQQFEAGAMRKVEFDFTAMSFADTATRLDKVELGKTLEIYRAAFTQKLKADGPYHGIQN